ncbi:single-stranded DNA-binding protein [Thermomonospora cellulosilytica]|uniref:Single-stranded DNA-binding protein n=1 Tax=Thermomonospora cellulosilytica TaxID=1411118 RepID=A0A7W3MU94_9ACTN|nr:single-stranded DNA-binding protein [Thermomonospora cellulosilytica]MBA9002031.1 single-strand DNA-binding protein [Thermomonospora cellulosilytica]
MPLPTMTGTARLTHDPELRFGQSGVAVAKVSLAFNSRRKNQAGEWEDGDTFFVTGTLFGDRAEAAAEHLAKGTEVEVRGRLKTRTWEQDGVKRSAAELLIDAIAPTLRSAAKKAARTGGNGQRTPQPAADPWATGGPSGFSDEPPF